LLALGAALVHGTGSSPLLIVQGKSVQIHRRVSARLPGSALGSIILAPSIGFSRDRMPVSLMMPLEGAVASQTRCRRSS
jgi:hypothetical protein